MIKKYCNGHFVENTPIKNAIENHLVKLHKSIKMIDKQLNQQFVKTTNGVSYLQHPKPQGLQWGPQKLRE